MAEEFEKRGIEFLDNQDGAAETEFMTRLSSAVFPRFSNSLREAYLLNVRYDEDPQSFVALCIVTLYGADYDAIRGEVQAEFAKIFSDKTSLDIVFPNVEQQKTLARFQPFYSIDRQGQRRPDFYLASTEGYGLREPRSCWLQNRVDYGERNDIALVTVSPPIDIVRPDGSREALTYLALAGRHVGESIFDDHDWPLYVHIAKLADGIDISTTSLPTAALENVAWGEIYSTIQEACKFMGSRISAR